MRIVGLDLAGLPRNDTGYCLLTVGDKKDVTTCLLHSDEEILLHIQQDKPELVAVDAPLINCGQRRDCDDQLAQYGALPITLAGMQSLAQRGMVMAKSLKEMGIPYIEINVKASAKILGVYGKKDFNMQKSMMGLDIEGDLSRRILLRDELDAITASLTGYLYLVGSTRSVGDEKGCVEIPTV